MQRIGCVTIRRMPNSICVAELALRLHETDKTDLRLDLEAGTIVDDDRPPVGYVLTEHAIEFDSLAERNRHTAEFAYEGLQEQLAGNPDRKSVV